jgi:hypothetical protein
MNDEITEKILESRRAMAAAHDVMEKVKRRNALGIVVVVVLSGLLIGWVAGLRLQPYLDRHFDALRQSEAPMLALQLPENEYLLGNVRVVDADTIDADIRLPLGVTLIDTRIRLSDFDAWESSRRRRTVVITDEEIAKGKQAAKLLEVLIKSSERSALLLAEGDRDVYGRVLGRMVVYRTDGSRVFVADFMREHGMLRNEENGEVQSD